MFDIAAPQATDAVADGAGPVFHLDMVGTTADKMIQYMVALKVASLVPGCRISNVHLPTWLISHKPVPVTGNTVAARTPHHLDIGGLSARMNGDEIQRVDYRGFGQRMENFLAVDAYRSVFVCPFEEDLGFGSDVLLCPVRAGDSAERPTPDCPLTPPRFYQDVVAKTGLTPVFMGQTGPDPYTDRLRRAFPNAMFLESRGPMRDFETIRQSRNIVVGAGTFAWLAAWLSRADSIHLAVAGAFNPMHQRAVDLLPFDDRRYRFYLFPLTYAVGLDAQLAALDGIAPYWRLMPPDMLRRQFAEAPRFKYSIDDFLAAYDEDYYLSLYRDVQEAVSEGRLTCGRFHYARWGLRERRTAFPLDRAWYATRYPLAAFEVAQGDYEDFAHHYLAVGKDRGYKPFPDP
jgi:hypothetical protein